MINVAAPIIEQEEIDAVNAVLLSGVVAQGPKVAELEESFARYCGTKYAVAFNSGTAAIHSALHSAGVGRGDEVITTPFSFIATINPILMLGAIPKLVDVRLTDFNINPELIEGKITAKTKAIIAVDLYGQPYDYSAISEIASSHNLVLIEDACQAVGAQYKDQKAGSLGAISCFSLYATKNIMSAEGGVMTTDDETFVKSAKAFRQHGMVGPYQYEELGYNYRTTDILAAIGIEQLKKVDGFNAARQRNAAFFDEGLTDIKGIVVPQVLPNRTHVYHQYTIRVAKDFKLSRAELMERLKEEGIGSGIYYPKALHAYPHIAKFGFSAGDFPNAELAAEEVLSLPIHPGVKKDDVGHIIKVIRDIARG